MGKRTGIQLCYPFEEKRLARWTPPYIVQPKYDGERCRAILDSSGEPTLLSSEENRILSVPHIEDALRRSGLRSVELDGELYLHGAPFETIHGIVSRKRDLHPRFEDMQLWVFDLISTGSQIDRSSALLGLYSVYLSKYNAIQIAPIRMCVSLEEIVAAFDHFCAEGYEGIIIREISAPYVRRRSTQVMKFKPKREDYYLIVGAQEEVSQYGEPKNRLGAILCVGQLGEETFAVGTGFSASDREYLWNIRDKLPGNSLRVAYQHTTAGRGVPRFPVYKEILWTIGDNR